MYVVKNSLRALLLAMIPLAVAHAAMTTFALLAAKAAEAEIATPDQVVMFYAAHLIVDGSLIFAGHSILRRKAISSRMAYAVMGAAAAAIGYAIAIRNSLELSAPAAGTVLTIGIIPTIAGALSGFLYGQFAGQAPAARFPALSFEGLITSMKFDGPVRVRTSIAGVFIAAMTPSMLSGILSITAVLVLPGYFTYLTGGPGRSFGPIIAAGITAQLFLAVLAGTIIPSAILVLSVHVIARVFHRRSTIEYAVIGCGIALICAHFLMPLSRLTTEAYLLIPAAAFGAIMGGLYRRFAGLEPVPLPEAVIATSTEALVGADHPSRRQHGVILSN